MNWIMIPVILIYVAVIYQIRHKIRQHILMNIVRQNILNSRNPFNPEFMIQGYNLVFAFVLLPILFLSLSMLFNSFPFTYNWLYSIIAYAVTITAL
jgi:hypothetical protein